MRRPITEEKFYVYVHSRRSNGEPFYVGKGLGARSTRPSNRSEHWNRVVAKAGGFYASHVSQNLDEELAFLLECELIDNYRRRGVRLVNQTDGGDGMSGFQPSQETRGRMSASKKGKHLRKRTPEEKIAMSERMKGTTRSPQTRAKMSASKKGRPSNRKGCRLSEETRRKLSAAKLGKKRVRVTGALREPMPDERKRRISLALTGVKKTPATRERMRVAAVQRIARKKVL